jgi:hypothetical protein
MNEFFISCSMEIGVIFEAVPSDIRDDLYSPRPPAPQRSAPANAPLDPA